MKKITAYLRFGGFERIMQLPDVKREVRIAVMLPLRSFDVSTSDLRTTPVLVFEWRKQLTRFTHEYSLKEIANL